MRENGRSGCRWRWQKKEVERKANQRNQVTKGDNVSANNDSPFKGQGEGDLGPKDNGMEDKQNAQDKKKKRKKRKNKKNAEQANESNQGNHGNKMNQGDDKNWDRFMHNIKAS